MDHKNSMLLDVQGLYASIFEDLRIMHPSISSSLVRDLSRLASQRVSSCGLPFYTIALPAACKWFDQSLAAERLLDPRPPHFGVKGGSDRRPTMFWSLFSEIFEPDGTLRSDLDKSAVASMRQLLLAAKKLRLECEERYTKASVQTFHEIERSLPRPRENTWSSDTPEWSSLGGHPIWGDKPEYDGQTSLFDTPDTVLQLDSVYDWDGLRRFSGGILHQFGPFDPYTIRSKHGPGAVSDRLEPYVKYDFAYWSERLEQVFPYDWHASTDFSVPDYARYKEFHSKMHAVPKTQAGPRLIAAEPTSHQWIQQGIRRWLESRTKVSCLAESISFDDQTPSRELALRASANGEMTTVDLSSASDRLTCRLVEYIFQSNRPLLDALHASRTRALVDLYGEMILLRKFASQGSAVIFPLQSIVYAILAAWSVMVTTNRKDWSYAKWACSQVRVFGDDIIVPTYAYPVLAGLLKSCLLKVNDAKTHSTGYFRESCGMDAFQGTDVTPAYFREGYSSTPESLASVLQCSNNFFKKGYWHAAKYLETTIPEKELKLIPVGERFGSASLFSFCGESVQHLRGRWNDKLQIEEHLVLAVSNKSALHQGSGNGSLVQFFNEEPDPLLPYRSGQVGRSLGRKSKRWVS
nr:MAG: RNA-dependent RNA polymerase [Riboviria sp.]